MERYGPALDEAYELESERAKVPRIAISERLTTFFAKVGATESPEPTSRIARELVTVCEGMIERDRDDVEYLNFLGPSVWQLDHAPVGLENLLTDLFVPAREFVNAQLSNANSESESSVREKYQWLHDYFELSLLDPAKSKGTT